VLRPIKPGSHTFVYFENAWEMRASMNSWIEILRGPIVQRSEQRSLSLIVDARRVPLAPKTHTSQKRATCGAPGRTCGRTKLDAMGSTRGCCGIPLVSARSQRGKCRI